ncbi:MAG: hypothetical protein HY270_03120 [Deltaproteobacteria bacterium]|nr:hypothetical protein [Deltaproteobacteria bacterium]
MSHRHRQERWLHTRISPDLEQALKREARKQRTPVSLLVRNVLEGALDLVEEIVEDSLEIADTSRRFARRVSRAARGERNELADIYGWQEIILNREAVCGACASTLAVGLAAHRGLSERSRAPVFLCSKCIRQLRQPGDKHKEEGS